MRRLELMVTGAYSYNDPGIVYNLYVTPAGLTYKVPGPTVWSGAAPSVANPSLGTKKGPLTYTRWKTWVGPTDRTVTWVENGSTLKSKYDPTWTTGAGVAAATAEPTPA